VPIDRAFVNAMPKAEVHVHLEGCIPRALLAQVAERHNVAVPVTSGFSDLSEFLAILDACCALLSEPSDLVALGEGFGRRCATEGLSHVEAIVNPGHWPAWSGRLDTMLGAFDEGLRAAEAAGAPPVWLLVSIGRWNTGPEAEALVDAVLAASDPRIVGISLDGDESAAGAGSQRFLPALDAARAAGLHVAVHAGESSGPDGVRAAIEDLGAERIDHGIAAARDPACMITLAELGIPLDICPTSNIVLGLVSSYAEHPIETLRRSGVRVCLNTDDPELFGTDLGHEYESCAAAFGWDRAVAVDLARTSIAATFGPDANRVALLAELDAFAAANP
jgi:adenosine deaminase